MGWDQSYIGILKQLLLGVIKDLTDHFDPVTEAKIPDLLRKMRNIGCCTPPRDCQSPIMSSYHTAGIQQCFETFLGVESSYVKKSKASVCFGSAEG
jgi:hypothetical protein